MRLSDSLPVPAAIEQVWAALNDAEVLRKCIPGCQNLAMTSPTEMTAMVSIKIGPIKATFSGNVKLSDLNPPYSYRMDGEGSGGIAGFAKGEVLVRLEMVSNSSTLVHYDVEVQIAGKLAQLGARLIESTAKKLAREFFTTFGEIVSMPVAQS